MCCFLFLCDLGLFCLYFRSFTISEYSGVGARNARGTSKLVAERADAGEGAQGASKQVVRKHMWTDELSESNNKFDCKRHRKNFDDLTQRVKIRSFLFVCIVLH
jgi:hypothetical protein